jgi:Tfp pilus assembly protein PilV
MLPAVQRLPSRRRSRSGATLIEILVACLILAVVAVGTAACLYLSQGATAVQRNRRTALELANSRLEELRTAPYTAIDPTANNTNLYYIDRLTGSWHVLSSDQGETVNVNGRSQPITTTVRFVDADGAGVPYECVRLTVTVKYGRSASETVTLETLKSP